FKDDEFLAEFVKASHPEVQDFIDKYITGGSELPFATYFDKLGYEYSPVKRLDFYLVANNIGLKYDEVNKAIAFTGVDQDTRLCRQSNDWLMSVENDTVTEQNIEELWEKYFDRNDAFSTL